MSLGSAGKGNPPFPFGASPHHHRPSLLLLPPVNQDLLREVLNLLRKDLVSMLPLQMKEVQRNPLNMADTQRYVVD
jgi:hypothetical protein